DPTTSGCVITPIWTTDVLFCAPSHTLELRCHVEVVDGGQSSEDGDATDVPSTRLAPHRLRRGSVALAMSGGNAAVCAVGCFHPAAVPSLAAGGLRRSFRAGLRPAAADTGAGPRKGRAAARQGANSQQSHNVSHELAT